MDITTESRNPIAAASAHDAPERAEVQRALDAAAQAGAPGIVAEIHDRHGQWFGSAGSADTGTDRKRRPQDRFRIGSTTKAFTSTVVLQLVAEGLLSLDDTVECRLPGLVHGNGNDGGRITIRQLLNQTSGLYNYGNDPEFFAKGVGPAWFEHRYDSYTPAQLVKIATAHPPHAGPGEAFSYSNTNYVLAAMIIEEVTGRTYGQELTRRITCPLGLAGTSLPDGPGISGPHPMHYSTLFSQAPEPTIHDATEMDQTFAWSAGGIISTTGDLQRFSARCWADASSRPPSNGNCSQPSPRTAQTGSPTPGTVWASSPRHCRAGSRSGATAAPPTDPGRTPWVRRTARTCSPATSTVTGAAWDRSPTCSPRSSTRPSPRPTPPDDPTSSRLLPPSSTIPAWA